DDRSLQIRTEPCQLNGLFSSDLVNDRDLRVAVEGPPIRQELVKDRPDREDIAALIDASARHLLRRHVARRPDALREARQARLKAPSDPEVENLDRTVLAVDHDVVRLQVAVHEVGAVDTG